MNEMAGGGMAAATKRAQSNGNGTEARQYATIPELRERAKVIRDSMGYPESERLTPGMLLALAPLLNEPIDPRYIETIPPQKGKPYESTGIRSVQVQIDRLNAILGEAHWRKMLHYTDGGQVCHAHIVVGNDLAHCVLDDAGNLLAYGGGNGDAGNQFRIPEVIAHREGRGGHSHGSNRGDLYKGAETNALKRVIAQLGPGSEVYRLDFDEDSNPTASSYSEPQEPTPDLPTVTPEDQLAEILAVEDDLAALRREVDTGLQLLGANVPQRLKRLEANTSAEALTNLKERLSLAVEERDAQLSIETS